MKRLLRWMGMALGILAILGLVAYAVVYVRSERILNRSYEVPTAAITIPTDALSLNEGRRLAIIHGCFDGCHGKEVEGAVMIDEPLLGRIVAPNLTAAVRKYSDPELIAAIRHGVRPDGHGLMVMPAEAFVVLTDEDLGRIIGFLKSLPATDGPGPSISFGPMGRIGIANGQFMTAPELIAETIPPPDATTEEASHGRYLARTTCAQCHRTNLRGDSNPGFTSPNLGVVAAYPPRSFAELMRTGMAIGGRNLPMMGPWSRHHFSYFTDSEIASLYSYLHELRDTPRE